MITGHTDVYQHKSKDTFEMLFIHISLWMMKFQNPLFVSKMKP